jgi:L-iditol 2-dehydrogenase
MKAVFLTGIGKLEMREIPAPQLQRPDDVLLRVEVVGVCGSDMHYFKEGRIGCQVVQFPWIVGHEFGGTIVEAGPEAGGRKKGQRVAVDPLVACGACDQCTGGRAHTCRSQIFMGCPGQMPGCMCEYVVMPARCCFPLPKSLTAQHAALSEPFSIALHARNLGQVQEGSSVAILGCGPIGLCVLAAIKRGEPCEVYATDLLDGRLEMARRFEADATYDAASQDVVQAILEEQPLGMQTVFECAGKPETIDQAIRLLAPGGRLVLVGIPPEDRISLDFNDLRRKELTVQCVRRQNECVEPALEMLDREEVRLDALVTHHFRLDQSQEAFDLVANYRDGVVKAMIHVGSPT